MKKFSCLLFSVLLMLMSFGTLASADSVTSADVTLAVQQGQWFLFNQQQSDGHFSAGATEGVLYPDEGTAQRDYPLATTCMVVSALLETGVPASDVHIEKGIEYILSFWDETTGKFIPQNTWEETYNTGVVLMALSLYGSATEAEETKFPGFSDKVKAAYDYLLSFQNNGNNGVASDDVAFNDVASDDVNYGGWTYTSDSFSSADMSNTQYAAMGLWYASRYLGYSLDDAEWDERLLIYVSRCHGWDATNDQAWADGKDDPDDTRDGGFSYLSTGESFYPGGCQTGGALWNLAMIGEDQNPMVDVAINWFRHNYTWSRIPGSYYDFTPKMGYYYFVYGMGKALTAIVPPDEAISGDVSWTQDLLDIVIPDKILVSGDIVSDENIVSGDVCYWPAATHRDGNDSIATSFVLMSLAFSDPSTEASEKHLAQPDDMLNPVQGMVTIRAFDGVGISGAFREEASSDQGIFPIGAFHFILRGIPAGAPVNIRFEPPAGAFDPETPWGFIDPDGLPKDTLRWMQNAGLKTQNTKLGWSPLAGVKINVNDPYIDVTLTDDGAGDSDNVPGQITVTRSALGLLKSADTDTDTGSSGGCNVSVMPLGIMLILPLALLLKR